MRIKQTVDVPAPVEKVWAFLQDVPRVAMCMPGATLKEIVDPDTFVGTVSIKVGPIGANYHGRLVMEERNSADHTIRMKAAGKDRKGAGTANATIVASLTEPSAGLTQLSVASDIQLSGRIATLGRGIQDVAGKIIGEFAERLSAEVGAGDSTEPPTGSGAFGAAAPADSSVPTDRVSGVAATGGAASPPDSASAVTPALHAGPSRRTPDDSVGGGEAAPIKMGGLLWSILRDKIRELFSRRKAKR